MRRTCMSTAISLGRPRRRITESGGEKSEVCASIRFDDRNLMTNIDLQSFKQALAELQRKVDDLDSLKAGYHEEVLECEDEVS